MELTPYGGEILSNLILNHLIPGTISMEKIAYIII